jgi:ATP-binding cassette subfamily B protein/ATP-binding cassette subfamily C protein
MDMSKLEKIAHPGRSLWRHTVGKRGSLAAAMALSIIASALTLAQPKVVELIISGARDHRTNYAGLIAILGGLVLATGVASGVKSYLVETSGEWLVAHTRQNFISRIVNAPMRKIDQWRPGDIGSRATADADNVRDAVTSGAADLLGSAVLALGSVAALILIDAASFAVVLAAVACVVASGLMGARLLQAGATAQQAAVGEIGDVVARFLKTVQLVRAYNLTQAVEEQGMRASEKALAAGYRIARIRAWLGPLSTLSVETALMVVLVFGAFRVSRGDLSIGDLTAFILYVSFLVAPAATFANAISSIGRATGSYLRISEIDSPGGGDLAYSSAVRLFAGEQETTGRQSSGASAVTPAVSFINACFRYENNEARALDNVSFDVAAGELVVIVGSSGAGKSTLMRLLHGFYAPDRGRVLVEGTETTASRWCPQDVGLALVPQESSHWGRTMRESICLGADVRPEELRQMLDRLQLGRFVASLTDGLDTSTETVASRASVGEMQRMAIARALLSRPRILALDEATSNLDEANEAIIDEIVCELRGSMTIIAVAHRPGLIAEADRVIRLEHGKIMETVDRMGEAAREYGAWQAVKG